jgi:predicted HNH restriction endonuclease
MTNALNPGYILHADPAWVEYHLANSVGRTFGYTRRVGARMRNVAPGGAVFFMRRGQQVKEAAFWGHFLEDVETTPAAAWEQFGTSLGASSYDEWMDESLDFIDDLTPTSPIRVLRFERLTIPHTPIPLKQAGVEVKRNSVKGWSIGAHEVQALLGFDERLQVPPDPQLDEAETDEGRRRLVVHFRIERNLSVVRRAKELWLQADPQLRCSCCRMSFIETYGDRGRGYIEAHHTKPLAQLLENERVVTRVEDLVAVCGNCHRMLHREPAISHAELSMRFA